MGIGNSARADTAIVVVNTVSAADTTAATSAWIDVRAYKGELCFIQQTGAITGTLNGKIQSATAGDGTGAADITGATFTAVSAANKIHKCLVPATTAPYMRYVGTVATGPVLLAVSLLGHIGTSA